MNTVKITCDTGKTWITSINTDLEGAKSYFLGQAFTDETDDGKETRNIAVSVEMV